jgi:hypothetical protein
MPPSGKLHVDKVTTMEENTTETNPDHLYVAVTVASTNLSAVRTEDFMNNPG